MLCFEWRLDDSTSSFHVEAIAKVFAEMLHVWTPLGQSGLLAAHAYETPRFIVRTAECDRFGAHEEAPTRTEFFLQYPRIPGIW